MKAAGLGALGLALGIEAVPAAAQKAPAAAGTNPLFTGALGRYEGVSIIHSPGDPLADLKYYAGEQWTQAQRDLLTRGSAAVMVEGNKGRWIPFNKLIRQG